MKSKFIKSTIVLIVGGAITKILAMIIKIFLTRIIGNEGISIYMYILPTFNLFITLSTLSLATSISKIVSEKGYAKKIILPIIPVTILYSFFMMFIIIILAPFIAKYFLNNIDIKIPLMGIGFTLPFITFSNLLKGYFYGKERMIPYVFSNIFEQIIRFMCILLIIPNLIKYGQNIAVLGVVLINVISEFASIICLICFIPKSKIKFEDFKINTVIIKDILNISLANTGSRLIGSISYFLEPILVTNIMLLSGYNNDFIRINYGIVTGYVFSLLLIPSFFSSAISTSLLPIVSNNYIKGNYNFIKRKLNQAIKLSFIIGVFFTCIFMIMPDFLLSVIYKTNTGGYYVKIIAPFFLLHYIQSPLTVFLQAIGKAKSAMMGTLFGAILKNIMMCILCYFFGIWGFIISDIFNILFVTIHHYFIIRKFFRKLNC